MSPALVAAIHAIASCVDRSPQSTPNSSVQRFPEPRDFFEEALDLLQEGESGQRPLNIFSPSITACQGGLLFIAVLTQIVSSEGTDFREQACSAVSAVHLND